MKILITGGSGFIGTNLIEYLLNNQFSILNIDKKEPINESQKKYWQKVDILNFKDLENASINFEPEIIIHLAAVTDLDGKNLEYYSPNIIGTQNLIDISKKIDSLKKVIFTSSMYVCKPGFTPIDYNTYAPHTVYGESKVQMELLIKEIKESNFSWTIIRPTSIWGPWFNIPYIDFFKIVYQKKYFEFSKACTKTYGFIDNTVFQIVSILKAEHSLVHEKVFYLGDNPPINIAEWGNEISLEMHGKRIPKIPFSILKLAAIIGDGLKKININFPITSIRLSNMTTNNVFCLDDIYEITGEILPCNRLDGIRKTLEWLKLHHKYSFVQTQRN